MGHAPSQYPNSRAIDTTTGPIIGRRLIHEGEKLVDAFQGIPYAAPPVGPLRFRKPEPHPIWTDVKECKGFGNRSIQKGHMGEKKKLPPMSEDCLNLNVFTPVWEPNNEEGFPVLVFIHGGAFLGDSAAKYGDVSVCEHICKKDVVFVTLQYRVGFLGMWTSGDDCCPGNLLLWDMTLALHWIQQNIRKFNGNPENVTLMGQSAGGAAVDLLSLSPHSRDLFHKVIPMAGNASCDFAVNYGNVEYCRESAEAFGVKCCWEGEKYLEELRKLPAEVFALSMDEAGTRIRLGPRIDKEFIPKHPDELRKEAPPKPRLYGMCRSEWLLFMMGDKRKDRDTLADEVAARFFPENEFPEDFYRLRKEYAARVGTLVIDGDKKSQIWANCQAKSDEFLGIGTQKAVMDSLETGNAPVYLYRMDYCNVKAIGGLISYFLPFKDASHCTDISYVVAESIGLPHEFDQVDLRIVELMTTLWTNFAKYGDPNGKEGDPSPFGTTAPHRWDPSTKEDPQRHLQIDIEPKMSSSFFDGRPHWYLQQVKECKKQ